MNILNHLTTLLNSPNPDDRKLADIELVRWQKSSQAWTEAHTFLTSQNSSEVHLIAAQTLRSKIFYDIYQLPDNAGPNLCMSLLSILPKFNSSGNRPVVLTICQSLAALALQGSYWWLNPAKTFIDAPRQEQTRNLTDECIILLLTSLADKQLTKKAVTSSSYKSKLKLNLESEYGLVLRYLLETRTKYDYLRSKIIICWCKWNTFQSISNFSSSFPFNPLLEDCITHVVSGEEQEVLDSCIETIIRILRCSIINSRTENTEPLEDDETDYANDDDLYFSLDMVYSPRIVEAKELHNRLLEVLPLIQETMARNHKNEELDLLELRLHLYLFLLRLEPRPISLISSSVALMNAPTSKNLWDLVYGEDYYGFVPSYVGTAAISSIVWLIEVRNFPPQMIPELCKIVVKCKSVVFNESINDKEFEEYQESLCDIIEICCKRYNPHRIAAILSQNFNESPIGTMLSVAIVAKNISPEPCHEALILTESIPEFPSTPPSNAKEGLTRTAALVLLSSCISKNSNPETYQLCRRIVLDEFDIMVSGLQNQQIKPICQKFLDYSVGILNSLAWKYRPLFFTNNEPDILKETFSKLIKILPYFEDYREELILESIALFIRHSCMHEDLTYSLIPDFEFYGALNNILYPSCILRMSLDNFSKNSYERGSDCGCSFFRALQLPTAKPDYNSILAEYVIKMVVPIIFNTWKSFNHDISICEAAGRLFKHSVRASGKYFAPYLKDCCSFLSSILMDPNFKLQSTHIYSLDWLYRLSIKYDEWDKPIVKTLIDSIVYKGIEYLAVSINETGEYTSYLSDDLFSLLIAYFKDETNETMKNKAISIACKRLANAYSYQEAKCLAKFLQIHANTFQHQKDVIEAAFTAMSKGACYGSTCTIATMIHTILIRSSNSVRQLMEYGMNLLPQALIRDPVKRQELFQGLTTGKLEKLTTTVETIDSL